jgi:hypothetical protein
MEIRFNRGHDDPGLHPDQIDTHEREAHPRIDHNSFVKNSIEHVEEAALSRRALDVHYEAN